MPPEHDKRRWLQGTFLQNKNSEEIRGGLKRIFRKEIESINKTQTWESFDDKQVQFIVCYGQ